MDQTEYESKSTKELFMELARVYFVKKYKVASEKGIHPGQEALLKLVSKESGLSQKEIALKLKIQPPTVAVSIKRMEKAGWLTREVDSVDKRISRVYITKEGQSTLEEVGVKTKELEKILFTDITNTEIMHLRSILVKLIQNLRTTIDQKEMDEVMEQFNQHHHDHKHSRHHDKK